VRVGVVGCGYWGSKHVRVMHGIPEVTQVVLIDPDPERRDALHAVFSGTVAYPSFAAAVDDVEAVVLATPPTSHAPLGLEILEAGKHLLVEKPLATSSADAERLVAAADDAGVVLMAGHTFEFNAAVRRLRDFVQDGELGDIYYVDSSRLNLGLYQSDVNVLWDLAPHDVSMANYVLDDRPTMVTAWGSRHADPRFEDVASIRLEYGESGAVATIRVSWLDPCKVRRTTVVGSRKMAVYDDVDADERIKVYDRGIVSPAESAIHEVPLSYRYGDVVAPYVDFKEPLLVEDQHFVEAAISGSRPLSDGESGLTVVRIVEAANQSIRTGQQVRLAPRVYLQAM
jgi:predicted dehydrogenase